MGLTASQIANAQTSLLFFIQLIFEKEQGKEFKTNGHHVKITDALERVLIGETTRLIINIPPRYSKTEMVIMFIAWSMGIYPQSKYINASCTKELATQNSHKVKQIIESETYQQIFNVTLEKDSKAKHLWNNSQQGGMLASGTEGTIIGYGAGGISEGFNGAYIIDDPIKLADANSKLALNKNIEFYKHSVIPRLNSFKNTPIILIMQRVASGDLSSYLLKSQEKWEQIILPIIKNNKPLWLERHDPQAIKKLKKDVGSYVYNAQYLQSPISQGGNLFKSHLWKYYELPPLFGYRFIVGDTALKTKEHNDNSSLAVFGVSNNKLYLIDEKVGKYEAPELERVLINLYNKHKNDKLDNSPIRAVYIEDKASGTGLIQSIKRNEKIPIVAIQRNRDKWSRAMDVIKYVESGYIYLPKNKPFINDFIEELADFNGLFTHKHDDRVDTLIDAVNIVYNNKQSQNKVINKNRYI